MTPSMAARARADSSDWEVLMAAAQDGDAAAYSRLLHAVQPHLKAIARKRLRNAADVEDAVQETLLSIHRLRHTYDPSRPLRPWLSAICQRRCVDHLRRAARAAATQSPQQAGPIAEQLHGPAADDAPLARIAAIELHQAVARLPLGQREALRMAKLEQTSLAEASARSGRSATAIRVATHRAIRALRLQLIPAEA